MRTIFLIFSLIMTFSLFAHEGGHGQPIRVWLIDDNSVVAEFVKYEDQQVFLMDTNHTIASYRLSTLTKKDQELVLKKHLKTVAINQTSNNARVSYNSKFKLLGLAALALLFFGWLLFFFRKKKLYLTTSALGVTTLIFFACEKNNVSSILPLVPANDVHFMTNLFGNFSKVDTDSDDEWFYVASDGLPEHDMMVGITNWQQQVPVAQEYTGNNRWAIPLQPVLSDNPLSTETNLLKGAIAIAANGIPIFNPLNNRGEDANVIGELDQWGGHCGRADDYHYHLPPAHLQSIVGAGNPIAYAVDGFPIYGTTTDELDDCLGKFNADGSYQYHTIADYPYFIAKMKGEVSLDPTTSAPENQVIPQAMTQEIRPAKTPLQGAEITNFVTNSSSSYSLTYTLNGSNYVINYFWDQNGLYTYEFVNPDGSSTVETYQR